MKRTLLKILLILLISTMILTNFQIENNVIKLEEAQSIQISNQTLQLSTKETLNSKITVNSGETFERSDTVILYEASESPMFEVHGTLKLINCTIVLSNPVSFIYIEDGTVYIRNVTVKGPEGTVAGLLFKGSSGKLHVENFQASVFSGADIGDLDKQSGIDDLYLSNLNITVSNSFKISCSKNITIVGSKINFFYQSESVGSPTQTRILDITSCTDVKILDNKISIPVEALEFYNCLLEAICLMGTEDVTVEGTEIDNAGKIIAIYENSASVIIVENIFHNTEILEGTELQVTDYAYNVTIANNSFSGIWEAVEIYSIHPIVVRNNVFKDCFIGVKVDTGGQTANVDIEKNSFIYTGVPMIDANGVLRVDQAGVLMLSTEGVTVENNYFENVEIPIMQSKEIVLRGNVLRNCTVYLGVDPSVGGLTENIEITNNTIYVVSGREWLKIEEENVKNIIVENNTIIEIEGTSGETGEESTSSDGNYSSGENEPPIFIKMIPVVVIAVMAVLLIGLKVKRGFVPKKILGLALSVMVISGVLIGMGIIKKSLMGPPLMGQPSQMEQGEFTFQLTEEELENILTLHIIDETDAEAAQVPESPLEPVNYPPANITKVSLGVHEGYLYVKFEFLGELPKQKEEQIVKITAVVLLDKDCNYSTGWVGIDAVIGLDIEWDENGQLIYGFGMVYNIPDTPNLEDEQWAIQQAVDAGYQMNLPYLGGPGYNNFVIQIPMDLLGLHSGKQVIMEIHAEAASIEYEHYFFDSVKNSQYNYEGPGQQYGEALKITIP